jgi:crotonobetainyl-CoA:carnitine CoA-transferase CaiB-like acyl-CoA transferase
VNSRRAIRFDVDARGLLHGVRVLDLSRLVAGNMLSLQLADFGADVIKIEPPHGDPLRDWRDAGRELYWKVYGRNKRSIVLNLRQPEARDALLHLVRKSDALIENYRPGTLEKMGLGPDVLLKANADLIIVRISGFGQSGPYAPLPGFGTLVEAMSGVAARTGFANREPVLPPFPLADMTAGLYGAFATMVALHAREQGQTRGQVIDLSLLESVFSILGPEAAIYQTTRTLKERVGSASHTSAPRNVYRCADGAYVALSASTQAMARRVFEAIGRPEMIEDARFCTNSARIKHRALVDEAVGGWFASRTREQASLRCAKRALRWRRSTRSRTRSLTRISASAGSWSRRGILSWGNCPCSVPPLSHTPGVWRRPAPRLTDCVRIEPRCRVAPASARSRATADYPPSPGEQTDAVLAAPFFFNSTISEAAIISSISAWP